MGDAVVRESDGKATVPYERGLLWKIQRGGQAPSYLFGTIHSNDERVLKLPSPVRAALARSRSLTLEVNPDSDAMMHVRDAMFYHDGRDLESVVGTHLYRRCAHLMSEYGIGEERVREMKPWAVVVTLSMPRSHGGAVLDLALYRRAVEEGRPVHGLESIEEQVSYFEGMTKADRLALLRETVRDHAELPRMFHELIRAYLRRDLGALMAINAHYLKADSPGLAKRFMVRFVTRRNRLMVKRMQPRLAEGYAFIAVGALHLPGSKGILHLLEQRGYRVSPVY